MSRRVKRRERRNRAAGLIHLLNQRYRQEWERAESLQRKLDRYRYSPLGPIVAALKWLRHRFVFEKVAALAEAAEPYTVNNAIPTFAGTVTVIIPFRDQPELLRNCLRSITANSSRRIELVLVNNGSTTPRTIRLLARLARRPNIHVLDSPGKFNFAALCNRGAEAATGECLLFLNNDTEVLTADWLDRMLELAVDPGVGIVGATLLYPDRTLQHVGIFPRVGGGWIHPSRGEAGDAVGDRGELLHPRCVPAVTAACMLLRREVFDELGGFDERYPTTFNDVDLCRRARARGYKVAITPHARLLHYESLSRGYAVEPVRENR